MSEEIERKLRARMDAHMLSVMGFTSNVAAQPTEPLTLDTLRKMMVKLPPRETWLSSRLFPEDQAICVSGPSENFTCAGPSFWLRAMHEFRRVAEPAPPDRNPLGMKLEPIEIDPWPDDSDETAKWRAVHWDRLREAFEVAMMPLPEWLRSPPKFGKHG